MAFNTKILTLNARIYEPNDIELSLPSAQRWMHGSNFIFLLTSLGCQLLWFKEKTSNHLIRHKKGGLIV